MRAQMETPSGKKKIAIGLVGEKTVFLDLYCMLSSNSVENQASR